MHTRLHAPPAPGLRRRFRPVDPQHRQEATRERNLDLDIDLSETEWRQLGEAAQANHALGLDWSGDDPGRIRVYLRDEEVRGGVWERLVTDEGTYGAQEMEISHLVFNDGRPYAHLLALPAFQPPAVTPQVEAAVEVGQEKLVREKWHLLKERAGLG